jgi:hypothetical protein
LSAKILAFIGCSRLDLLALAVSPDLYPVHHKDRLKTEKLPWVPRPTARQVLLSSCMINIESINRIVLLVHQDNEVALEFRDGPGIPKE